MPARCPPKSPMPHEIDHSRWHARLLSWAAWANSERGPRGFERPGQPEHGVACDELDAERVAELLAELRRRWPIAQDAVQTYYLARLWDDHVRGGFVLSARLGRAWGKEWVHDRRDGLRAEERAMRLVHRGVEALDALDRDRGLTDRNARRKISPRGANAP